MILIPEAISGFILKVNGTIWVISYQNRLLEPQGDGVAIFMAIIIMGTGEDPLSVF